MRVRGWIAVILGAFIVGMMTWLWMWLTNQSAHGNILCDAASASVFLGRVYIAFGLIAVCGLMAVASGIVLIRTGRANRIIAVAMFVLFIVACSIAASGASVCGSS